MEDKNIIGKIAEALINLEAQGELILTTSYPNAVATSIFHSALKVWFDETAKYDEPIECTIPYLLEQAVLEIVARFRVQNLRAREIVNAQYNEWLKTRTMKDIAEIVWHETPREMAARAYYHIELGKPDNRDLEYLEWRKRY